MEFSEFKELLQSGDLEQIRPYLAFEMMAEDSPKRNAYGDCPHIQIQDMCAMPIAFVELDDHGEQLAKIPFTRRMCRHFGVGDVELIQLIQDEVAKKATPICGLSGFMDGVDRTQPEKVYLATTSDFHYGASVICTYDFFQKAARKLGENYYVLPSSIDEVLLVKENPDVPPKEFRHLVCEVNCMAVDESERLTNNAYHYDAKQNLLETVDEYQTRWEKEKTTKREQQHRPRKRRQPEHEEPEEDEELER